MTQLPCVDRDVGNFDKNAVLPTTQAAFEHQIAHVWRTDGHHVVARAARKNKIESCTSWRQDVVEVVGIQQALHTACGRLALAGKSGRAVFSHIDGDGTRCCATKGDAAALRSGRECDRNIVALVGGLHQGAALNGPHTFGAALSVTDLVNGGQTIFQRSQIGSSNAYGSEVVHHHLNA